MARLVAWRSGGAAFRQFPPHLHSRLPRIALCLAAARLATGRPTADLAVIAASLPDPWHAVVEALLAVPDTLRPNAGLPVPMRQVVWDALELQGPEGQTLVERLPVPGA